MGRGVPGQAVLSWRSADGRRLPTNLGPPAGQFRLYLWPHEQIEQWQEIDSARWKIVVVDIGADALLNSTLTRSGTLERLAVTAQDKYLMCRCVPIAVEEMLRRGMFVARLAFTPIYNAFVEYFGGLRYCVAPG